MTKHVLILEDEAKLAENIARFLQSDGFKATVVATIAEALNHLQQISTDVVLLDVELPDGNALQSFSKMKQLAPGLHGVVMTARSLPEYRQLANDLGIETVLTKPFPLMQVAENIGN